MLGMICMTDNSVSGAVSHTIPSPLLLGAAYLAPCLLYCKQHMHIKGSRGQKGTTALLFSASLLL